MTSRMVPIGQNGNDGEYYLVEKVARQIAGDCQDQKLGGVSEGKCYWELFIQQAIAVIEIVREFDKNSTLTKEEGV